MNEVWHEVASESALSGEEKLAVRCGEWNIVVVKTQEGFFALNDRCTHQAAALSPGRLKRGALICPLHGARFEVASGRCIGGTYPDLRTFKVRVTAGMIEVAIPESTASTP